MYEDHIFHSGGAQPSKHRTREMREEKGNVRNGCYNGWSDLTFDRGKAVGKEGGCRGRWNAIYFKKG